MIAMVVSIFVLGLLVMAGALPGSGALTAGAVMVVMALMLSVIWAVATWGADRWIARARVSES